MDTPFVEHVFRQHAVLLHGVLADCFAELLASDVTFFFRFGGFGATVDGILAIWSRQSAPGHSGPGIGLVIAEVAMVAIAGQWLRTAWSRA